ncbi:MAG: polyphosphate kinase 1 [Lachnospiraceae bacterium]|nr:polyphosphate kinase 1 [Lachnospiraceae bacterium]
MGTCTRWYDGAYGGSVHQLSQRHGKHLNGMVNFVTDINLDDPKYYRNRELSWLQFDLRVLDEAKDDLNPLFERMRFLSISASNLDEFTVIRVASLKDLVHAGFTGNDIAGMNPTVQLSLVAQSARDLINDQYSVYNNKLLCELKEADIEIVESADLLSKEEKEFTDAVFDSILFPILTPVSVEPDRPFPLIKNETINIAVLLETKNSPEKFDHVIVEVPSNVNRLIDISKDKFKKRFIFTEEVVKDNLSKLLKGRKIVATTVFRIMRNADLTIDVEEAEDLLIKIEEQVKRREWGEVIRLDIENNSDGRILSKLTSALKVANRDIFFVHGPLDLTFLDEIYDLKGYERYKESRYVPQMPAWGEKARIYESIAAKDRLLFCPFESFDPVVNLIDVAADDPYVLAIKQTLYRVDKKSKIVNALVRAAKNGKQVTVLVELKARFDEEKNIEWARMLERAGAHVIYGLPKLKTHAKIALVIRKEGTKIKRYMHLGTGNYNATTSMRYTDIGLFTADDKMGEDATEFFNRLSGFYDDKPMNKLITAPDSLKKTILSLIDREKENALQGKNASIVAKMNSLCDADVIKALYEASCAGVKIDLIVRGICCLKVGVPGVSDNIKVRSIVGRFLEHNRIFRFENAGDPKLYLSSADWMPRNLERRVELMFPIEDVKLKEKLNLTLTNLLRDNVKARILSKDGRYYCREINAEGYNFQADYMSKDLDK